MQDVVVVLPMGKVINYIVKSYMIVIIVTNIVTRRANKAYGIDMY